MANSAENIDRVVSYLQHAFSKACKKFGSNNTKGTTLYKYQVKFMYMLDEVMRGVQPVSQRAIITANKLIDEIESVRV